jgi:2-polyprenyl-3-methyl-5-hydroxy-6-metoxy-1,4-benzoquinol methylase
MSDPAPTNLAAVLGSIDQRQCDEMGLRLSSISAEVAEVARRLQADDPDATPYAAPMAFTKIFTIIAAVSHGDVRAKTMLDVGCGGGGFMAQSLRLGMMPIGIDIYSGQGHSRAIAERLLEAAGMPPASVARSVRNADITCLPRELEGGFDFVVSLGMLEHVPVRQERIAAVQNMVRALKPGGTLILECAPNSRLPLDLFHFGPRYPLYHLLPDTIKRIYLERIIRPRRPDLNEVQRDPRFLSGVSVTDITKAIRAIDVDAVIVQAFPLVTRLAVSRAWLRRRRAQQVVGAISRLLVRAKMEPLILIVASRSVKRSGSGRQP